MEISVTKRIAKNFSWLTLGEILSRGLNLFAVIYIARILGAATFGLLNIAQAFLVYLVILVDSGLSILGTREIAKEKAKAGGISLNIFVIRFVIALIIYFVSFIILLILPLTIEMRLLFMATFLFVFYRAVNTDWVFQGLERMDQIALSKILFSTLAFILTLLLVKTNNDLLRVPFIQFASGIIASIIFIYILFKYYVKATCAHLMPANWWDYFSEAIPLGAYVILIQIYYNLDTIMLGFMDKPEVVGYYNAAYKVLYVFLGFLGLWYVTSFPVVSRRWEENQKKTIEYLVKLSRLTFLVVIPIVILVNFYSLPLIKLLFGIGYITASSAMQILIWNTVLVAVSSFYGALILIPQKKSKELLFSVGTGAIVNIVLNLILIPTFSFNGAAVATLIAEAAAALMMYYFTPSGVRINMLNSARVPIIASILAFPLLLFMSWGPEYFRVISGSFIYIIAYLVLILMFGERRNFKEYLTEVFRK